MTLGVGFGHESRPVAMDGIVATSTPCAFRWDRRAGLPGFDAARGRDLQIHRCQWECCLLGSRRSIDAANLHRASRGSPISAPRNAFLLDELLHADLRQWSLS